MSTFEPIVVDVHNHMIPNELLEAVRKGGFDGLAIDDRGDPPVLVVGGHPVNPIAPERTDLGVRLRDMDRLGVTVQAVSLMPTVLGYELSAADGVKLCELANDGLAATAAAHPGRFAPLATVPLQDPPAAVRELCRAAEQLGMRGIIIGANVADADPSDERFLPFWEAVADLDLFVFVHPIAACRSADRRLSNYHLANVLGHPFDTSSTIANLVFGGHLERWPNLKICFSHGGGYIPYQIGRLDHAYEVRPEARRAIPRPPSDYIRALYFDTITHNLLALRYMVEQIGVGQVLLGSDYPADMADSDPVATVNALGLKDGDRATVLGGTAARLLRIAESDQAPGDRK